VRGRTPLRVVPGGARCYGTKTRRGSRSGPSELQDPLGLSLDLRPPVAEGAVCDPADALVKAIAKQPLREMRYRKSDRVIVRLHFPGKVDRVPLRVPRLVEDELREVVDEVPELGAAPVENGGDAVRVDEHVAIDEVIVDEMPCLGTGVEELRHPC